MAVIRNATNDELRIPAANVTVAAGDTFEIEDSLYQQFDWSAVTFEVIEAPDGPVEPTEEELLEAYEAGQLDVTDLKVEGLRALAKALEISPIPTKRDDLVAAINSTQED